MKINGIFSTCSDVADTVRVSVGSRQFGLSFTTRIRALGTQPTLCGRL